MSSCAWVSVETTLRNSTSSYLHRSMWLDTLRSIT